MTEKHSVCFYNKILETLTHRGIVDLGFANPE